MFKKFILISLLTAFLLGCAVNPVTGSNEIVLIDEKQEINLGAQIFAEMQKQEGGLYTNQDITAYVQEVGMKLAQVSDRPNLPYEFVVLNNPIPNAWTLPGGKIAVNSGLLSELESEAELAAVLAHEIVHAAGRHGAQQMEKGLYAEIAAAACVNAAGEDSISNDLVQIGTALVMLKYSREKEFEADKFGIKYMSRAGYDTQSAIILQEKFLKLSDNKDPSWLEGLLATHPPSKERIEANKDTAQRYPSGGFIGKETYKDKIINKLI